MNKIIKMIKISLIKREDFDDIIELSKIIGKSSKYLSYGQEGISKEKLERVFEDKNMYFFSLKYNKDIIGTYQIYVNNRVGEFALTIDPKYQSMGIGTYIMKNILEFANSINLNELKLTVYKENIKAVNLYNKFDFKIIEDNLKLQEMSLKIIGETNI